MIIVDPREGSGNLAPYFADWRIPHNVQHLHFGDASVDGNGPEGRVVTNGIEIKAISDMINSIIDGRFVGYQLPGLKSSYEVVWLIVEGRYRAGSDGLLEVGWRPADHHQHQDAGPPAKALSSFIRDTRGNSDDTQKGGARRPTKGAPDVKKEFLLWALPKTPRPFMYRELEGFLINMRVFCGLQVVRTADREETAWAIRTIAGWWGKDWEEHTAHLGFHVTNDLQVALRKPTPVMEVAKVFPGVGVKKAIAADQVFSSVIEMVNAEVRDWEKVEGVGKGIGQKIWDWVRKRRVGAGVP